MALSEHIKTNRDLGTSICQRLTEEINELGFTEARHSSLSALR